MSLSRLSRRFAGKAKAAKEKRVAPQKIEAFMFAIKD
jgi:hypothetical protein